MKRSTFFCSRLLIILAFLALNSLAFSQTIGSPGTTVTAKGDFAVDSAFKARRIQAIIDREVDTSFTIGGTTSAVVLDTISADRTVTFPALPLSKKGTVLFVYNGNSSAFQWNVSGPVYQGNGTLITSLPRDGYIFQWDGGKWVLFSTSGGSGSISGDTLIFDAPLTQSGKHVGLDYNLLPQDTVAYRIYGDSLYQINYYGARGSTPAYRDSVAILGPADATHPGSVSTGNQTFDGFKHFKQPIGLDGSQLHFYDASPAAPNAVFYMDGTGYTQRLRVQMPYSGGYTTPLAYGQYGIEVLGYGSLGVNKTGDIPYSLTVYGNDAAKLPISTASTRPAPAYGLITYDSDSAAFLQSDGAVWRKIGSGSSGGGSSADSTSTPGYASKHYVDSLLGTANLIVQPIGTGKTLLFDRNDTLYHRRVSDAYALTWSLLSDSSLKATIDTFSIATRDWVISQGYGSGAGGSSWSLTGNSGTTDTTFGTTGAAGIKFITNNTTRMVLGQAGRLWYNASGPGLWNWNINDTAQFTSIKIGNPTIPSNSIRSLHIKAPTTQSIDYGLYIENSAGTRVFSVTNAGDVSGTIWGALNSTTYRFAGATGTIGVTNGGGTNGNLFSFVPLSTTTAVGTTNTPIVRIQMKFTPTAASNTGYYAGMLIDGANDESAGSTTPVYGALIAPTNTSVTNYTGLMVGTPEVKPSALVNINSTTQGFLPPRMTGTQAEAISSPAEGLMIYSTDGSGTTITSKGWWGYDGSAWVKLN